MLEPGDGLRQDRNPHTVGCGCRDPKCSASRGHPLDRQVRRTGDSATAIHERQAFLDADVEALRVQSTTYRSASQGHVRTRTPENDSMPEFVEVQAPGRKLFVSTRGMRGVHEFVDQAGEIISAQDDVEHRTRWQAYRDANHQDIRLAHQEWNERLLRFALANPRSVTYRNPLAL